MSFTTDFARWAKKRRKMGKVLAILEPEEVGEVALPAALTPPLTSDSVYGSQLCALLTDQNGITGHIRIPAAGRRPPLRVFVVAGKCAHRRSRPCGRANCLDAIRAMRPHNADGRADNFSCRSAAHAGAG